MIHKNWEKNDDEIEFVNLHTVSSIFWKAPWAKKSEGKRNWFEWTCCGSGLRGDDGCQAAETMPNVSPPSSGADLREDDVRQSVETILPPAADGSDSGEDDASQPVETMSTVPPAPSGTYSKEDGSLRPGESMRTAPAASSAAEAKEDTSESS